MRPTDSWTKARLTMGIAVVTAACWLIVDILGLFDRVANWGAFVPARVGLPSDGSFAPFWLTPLTATLIHVNLVHIGFNLLFLLFCGRRVENVLGAACLGILYLLGAYAAAGAQYLADPHSLVGGVGASGAISALLGAYAMLYGRNRLRFVSGRLAVWLNALWLMATWVFLNLAVGIAAAEGALPMLGEGMLVGAAAHIGGFFLGMILANPLLRFRWRNA